MAHRAAGMVAVVVEEVGLGQVEEEVHMGREEQRQPACPSRLLLRLKGLQTNNMY